jgi:sulfate adenylyltransferase
LAHARYSRRDEEFASKIALRDPWGVMLAVLNVEEVWQADCKAEAKAVFGSTSPAHPSSDYVMNKANP